MKAFFITAAATAAEGDGAAKLPVTRVVLFTSGVGYFERDGHEGQCTIVTEYRGPLVGKRVVRGREDEVAALFATTPLP